MLNPHKSYVYCDAKWCKWRHVEVNADEGRCFYPSDLLVNDYGYCECYEKLIPEDVLNQLSPRNDHISA